MKEITMEDIIQAIGQEIKNLFPKATVYDEGLEPGYKEPCFFIDYTKDSIKKLLGNRYKNLPKFRLVYFQDFKENEAKYKVYKVRDTLNEGFEMIKYKDMHFKVTNKEIEIQDKDLIFSFEIQYFTKKSVKEEPKFNDIEKITEKEKENAEKSKSRS